MRSETLDVKRETVKEAISKCLFCGNEAKHFDLVGKEMCGWCDCCYEKISKLVIVYKQYDSHEPHFCMNCDGAANVYVETLPFCDMECWVTWNKRMDKTLDDIAVKIKTIDVKRETRKMVDKVDEVNEVDKSVVVKGKPWWMGRTRFMVENLQEDVGHVNQGVGVVEELAEGILHDVGSLPGQVALIVDEKLARVTEILHEFKKMQRKQNHVLDQLAVRIGRIEDRLGIVDKKVGQGQALPLRGKIIDYRDETEGLRALVEHMRDNGLNENEIVEACKTAQFSEQDVRERCGDLLK